MRFIYFLLCIIVLPINTRAQEEARAAWQVTNFDIIVNNPGAERALSARATVSVKNVGLGAGSTLTLRLNSKAEVKSVTIGGSPVSYKSLPAARGGAQRITITLPRAVSASEAAAATIEYRLPIEENSGLAAISPIAFQFLPLSLWCPSPNTSFAVRGADYAPFRLTINGATAISSGTDKSAGGNSVFEQSLSALPFFVTGSWDQVDGGANAKGITAYLPKGAGAEERKQAEGLISLTNDARSFFGNLFGSAPDLPLRLVSVTRGGGFDSAGTILLGEGSFGRKEIDS